MAYDREHLSRALEWIEQNVENAAVRGVERRLDGVTLVARALAATAPSRTDLHQHVAGELLTCPSCKQPWKRAIDGGCYYCDYGHK